LTLPSSVRYCNILLLCLGLFLVNITSFTVFKSSPFASFERLSVQQGIVEAFSTLKASDTKVCFSTTDTSCSTLSDKMYSAGTETVSLPGTGDAFPLNGFGTWKIPKEEVASVIDNAIKAGYRHFDCACDYGNEVEVGAAFKKAIDSGIVKREELFIVSKLWNTFHAKEHVEIALRKSLNDLQLDYVDAYLIHFPISLKYVPIDVRYPPEWVYMPDSEKEDERKMVFEDIPYSETWKGMEEMVTKGLTRNIGVCNLNAQAVMDLMKYAVIKPAINQIEVHPYLVQDTLVTYCQSQGIVVTALSPLGSSSYISLGMDYGQGIGVLSEPLLKDDLSSKYNKTPAQIILRWNTQRQVAVIPKSSKADRIFENFQIFDFTIEDEDMKRISALNKNIRYNDPGEFCKGMGGSYPIYA